MRHWAAAFFFCIASLWAEPFGKPATTVIGNRTQLTFKDGTTIRLGANTSFEFLPGSREMILENGTLLFSSPKGAGGGLIHTRTTVVTLIEGDLQMSRINDSVKVICLNGKITVSSTADLKARDGLRPGEMIVVPPGATRMPATTMIGMARMIATSGLMQMGPLPSQAAIDRNSRKQKGPPKTSPPGASTAEVTGAMTTARISEQQAQQLAAQQAALAAAEQAAAQQQILEARRQQAAAQQAAQQAQQQAAQQAAAQQQQQQQQQQAIQGGGGGPQGKGPQGNQGKKPPAPPGQANRPPAPPGQQR